MTQGHPPRRASKCSWSNESECPDGYTQTVDNNTAQAQEPHDRPDQTAQVLDVAAWHAMLIGQMLPDKVEADEDVVDRGHTNGSKEAHERSLPSVDNLRDPPVHSQNARKPPQKKDSGS